MAPSGTVKIDSYHMLSQDLTKSRMREIGVLFLAVITILDNFAVVYLLTTIMWSTENATGSKQTHEKVYETIR